MTQRQSLISNELNKTNADSEQVEKFHAAECYDLLRQIGFISEEKVATMLDEKKMSARRNRLLEAIQKITFAKIASLEGNDVFAQELFSQVSAKISVLNKGSQQESALAYFYYEYAGFLKRIGDLSGAAMHLNLARGKASSNKLKQMIAYQYLVMKSASEKNSTQKKWLQSIAYFDKYEMRVMESQAHYELSLFLMADDNLGSAVEHLDRAHEIATTWAYENLKWNVDFIKGCLLVDQRRQTEALRYFQGLLTSVTSNYFKVKILLKVAGLHKELGANNEALETAKTCMEISQRFAMGSELAEAGLILGELYHRNLSDINKAFFYYQQAYGSVITLAKRGVPINSDRQNAINDYVNFLEEHFPGDSSETANEDLFAFSSKLTWVKIKDLFHYNLFLYHYMNTGVGNKTLDALDFPASSFYSATERLRSRGITFPNFRRNDVEIPSENYVEGLQQYCRLHREKTWVEINERFEKDMLAYHYKLNNYNKKFLAKNLDLAYSGIVNRTKYLTSREN
ncbi:MAG: hypothetical protein HQ508_04240 [Candidatus Marinimicrobia bacterium]|nr:hypothetical protein [Candidatus Neomarinimicrobiota bacterium]